MIHPEIIVVERVVDTVGPDEGEAHGGYAEKIQEHGVVGAAADAGVGEFSVGDGLVVAQFGLARNFPFVVESFSGGSGQGVANIHEQRGERADGVALKI